MQIYTIPPFECAGVAGFELSGVVLTCIVRGTSVKIDADCAGASLAGLIALVLQCKI